MRTLALAIVILIALTSFAQPAEPWKLSPEERVRLRFDAASLQKRMEEQEQLRTRIASGEDVGPYAISGPGNPPIEGSKHPELFMKYELFISLLQNLDEQWGERGRARYRDDIRAAGWDERQFWTVLATASSEHRRILDARIARETEALRSGRTVATKESDEWPRDEESLTICRSRFDAMTHMREAFGGEAFDRFLYTAVAPRIGIFPDRRQSANAAQLLLYVESGCQ